MVKLQVKTNVKAPGEITVHLVNAEDLNKINVFRICFEIFLAITASLGGVMLSMPNTATIHWMFFTVVSLSMIAFLALYLFYRRRMVTEYDREEKGE